MIIGSYRQITLFLPILSDNFLGLLITDVHKQAIPTSLSLIHTSLIVFTLLKKLTPTLPAPKNGSRYSVIFLDSQN